MTPPRRAAAAAFAHGPALPLRLSRPLRLTTRRLAHPPRFAATAAPARPPQRDAATAAPAPAAAGEAGGAVLTFQDAVRRLEGYWAERGCVLWHPYNTEVGAGTMNPATFLRVLGPEPWAVAYEEPSVRPDDSRYGENPNRLQCHTQFQVIVKPAPVCAQELVVGSYRALGIDVTKRDIRFVEDNWESPALGAWGLGWEVWLDGMEITQFTYFQQAGSQALDSVAVEITYGLERIIMALQGKTHFKDIVYAPGVTYGEILMQNEVEMSRYNMDDADVARSRDWFDSYEAEATQLLEKRLPVPAYNFLLKASHTFNVLDARGAVGVTERARYFQRMRDLARSVGQLWVERREELEFPMLPKGGSATPSPLIAPPLPPSAPALAEQTQAVGALAETCDFALELGVEELPAGEVSTMAGQVETLLKGLLADARLSHGDISVHATPRRVSVTVARLQSRQADESKRVRGPPLRAAVAEDGEFTKAGRGFLKKQGVVDDAKVELDQDSGYMFATVDTAGRDAAEVLSEEIPVSLLAKITSGKTMRWNASGVAFSRPIRWMLCLLDSVAVPFEFAGLASGTTIRSLRGKDGFAADVAVPSAATYGGILEKNQIVVSRAARAERIKSGASELASSIGGCVPSNNLAFGNGDLLDEVTDLVENPLPLLGRFDDSYLSLPEDVLVTVMRKHQRYLPVVGADSGELMAAFITVVNGDAGEVDMDAIRAGNEAVLRARYADAAFFYNKDTDGKKLADFVPELAGLTFQEKLGSMLDKVERVKKATPAIFALIGGDSGMDTGEVADALQIASLYKADLGTSMVVEMTSLAGIMGRHYALRSGEVSTEVADGILEAALPRFSGDKLPSSRIGAAVAIADRVDSLVSLFSVGLMPKSTADPFALRRAALGVVQTLISLELPVDLRSVVGATSANEKVAAQVLDFISKRLEAHLGERGLQPDIIKATLAVETNVVDPCRAFTTASALQAARDGEESSVVADAQEAQGRAQRLVKSVKCDGSLAGNVDKNLFEEDVEHALLDALGNAEASCENVGAEGELMARLRALSSMKNAVDAFCDGVFVAAEDERVRSNRIALLLRVANISEPVVDLSLLQM